MLQIGKTPESNITASTHRIRPPQSRLRLDSENLDREGQENYLKDPHDLKNNTPN